jgi:hypothetical protein
MKYQDASYPVNTEALRYYDNEILNVLRATVTYDKYVTTRTLPRGKADVKYWTPVTPSDPNYTYDFREPNADKLVREESTQKMVGIHKDCYIPMTELDGSAHSIERADAGNVRESTALVGEWIDKTVLRGTDIYAEKTAGTLKPVGDLTGLFNATGVNTLGAGGAGIGTDDDLTAIGDIITTTDVMIGKLREDKHYGPYALVVTDGVARQMTKNYNATTNATEWQLFQQTFMNPANAALVGYIKAVYVSRHLANAALTTSNQEMMLLEPKPSNFYLAQTYPLERGRPFIDKKEGLNFTIRWKGAAVVKRPTAICISVTLTTSAAH